jgi:hypothetical protein
MHRALQQTRDCSPPFDKGFDRAYGKPFGSVLQRCECDAPRHRIGPFLPRYQPKRLAPRLHEISRHIERYSQLEARDE